MTSPFVPLRRIVVPFVAIALFAAPVASAQAPDAAPPKSAQSSAALLSPSAFARAVKSAAPIVAVRQSEKPRPDLLKQGQAITAALTRTAVPGAAQPPRRGGLANWQKQVLFWGGIVGGLIVLSVIAGHYDD